MPGRASSLPPSRAENQNRLGYATSAARVDLARIGATAGASRGHLLVARLTPGKQTRYALFVPRCESRRKGNMAFLLFYVFHLLRKNSSMSTKLIPKIRICKHTKKKTFAVRGAFSSFPFANLPHALCYKTRCRKGGGMYYLALSISSTSSQPDTQNQPLSHTAAPACSKAHQFLFIRNTPPLHRTRTNTRARCMT